MSDVPANGISWRLGSLETRVQRLEDLDPSVVRQQVKDVTQDVRDLRDDFKAVKQALYTAALTFAGGAILIAVTAWQITGH